MIKIYYAFLTSEYNDRKLYEYGVCLYLEGIMDSNNICIFDYNEYENYKKNFEQE